MTAGEGIAAGFLPGRFQDGEILIPHPGPGDSAQQLHKLAGQGTKQAHAQDIVTLILIHAPKDDQRHHKERRFLAQLGDAQHQFIQPGNADLFQQVQKFHGSSSRDSDAFIIQQPF